MNANQRMSSLLSLAAFTVLALALPAPAETTPMDAELKEDAETMISCHCVGQEKEPWKSLGELMNDKGPSDMKKAYHYRLYIPKGYHADKETFYPCMFIADPLGKAQMQQMTARVKKEPWIVVMLIESINDSSESHPNFLAAHDDVMKRARVARGLKFATGASGGARCASLFPLIRPGFRGIICQAAGMAANAAQAKAFTPELLIGGSFGTDDFNLWEGLCLRRNIRQCDVRVDVFKGGHTWAPGNVFDDIVDWMEEAIFVDARNVKSGSAAQAPGGKLEPTGVEAFRWYFNKNLRELEEAKKPFERYLVLRRALAAARNGKLDGEKTFREKTVALQAEFAKLARDAEVVDGLKAEPLFRGAAKAESGLLDLLRRTNCAFKSTELKPDERAAMRKCASAYQAVIDKLPDSPFARTAMIRTESFNLELAEPPADAGKGKDKQNKKP